MNAAEIEFVVAPEALRQAPGLAVFSIGAAWLPDTSFDLAPVAAPAPDEPFVLDTLASHPRVAVWRDVYRAMGLKPSAVRSSVEQLIRRDLSGGMPVTGIGVVDLYNRVSRGFAVPMGGYDLERLGRAPVVVRPLAPGDSFEPIGGGVERMLWADTVLAYCQADRCLCYALNHRDDLRTAITAGTTQAVFVSEAVDAAGADHARLALEALAGVIRSLGGSATDPVKAEVG